MSLKCGIVGLPNVGKSTLMNVLLGEKLSIITNKAQTTRHRILGILNEKDFQIVFSDTPGVIKPSYRLQENMMNFVHSAFQDADVLVYKSFLIFSVADECKSASKINCYGPACP